MTDLTDRELTVLVWLSKGKRYAEISVIMQIPIGRVSNACNRILNKLGANSAAGAVGLAIRKGIIT